MIRRVLITSGPTRMPLDSMRLLTNRSTGAFGTLLANASLKKKWRVTFVHGKGSLTPKKNPKLKIIEVETNQDVARVLKRELTSKRYDAVIHAMAVLDFQAKRVSRIKTKTKWGAWHLELVPTPKIINQIKKWAPKILLVGFKLETGITESQLLKEAVLLMKKSKADFVLANQLSEGADTKHSGILLNAFGKVVTRAKGKVLLAKRIIEQVSSHINL